MYHRERNEEDFLVLSGEALPPASRGARTPLRHGVGVEEETSDAEVAYARFPKTEPTRYRDGWLPT
jgi:hypothetical protein